MFIAHQHMPLQMAVEPSELQEENENPQRQCFPKTVIFLLPEPARAKENICCPHIQCSAAAEEKKHFDFKCPFLLQVFDALRCEQPVQTSTVPIFQPFLKNSFKHSAMCSMDWAKCSPGQILLISAWV